MLVHSIVANLYGCIAEDTSLAFFYYYCNPVQLYVFWCVSNVPNKLTTIYACENASHLSGFYWVVTVFVIRVNWEVHFFVLGHIVCPYLFRKKNVLPRRDIFLGGCKGSEQFFYIYIKYITMQYLSVHSVFSSEPFKNSFVSFYEWESIDFVGFFNSLKRNSTTVPYKPVYFVIGCISVVIVLNLFSCNFLVPLQKKILQLGVFFCDEMTQVVNFRF